MNGADVGLHLEGLVPGEAGFADQPPGHCEQRRLRLEGGPPPTAHILTAQVSPEKASEWRAQGCY